MNLVVPVSRNFLNNFFFQFLVDEGKSELVVGRALAVEFIVLASSETSMPFLTHHISYVSRLNSVLEVHVVSDEGNLETSFLKSAVGWQVRDEPCAFHVQCKIPVLGWRMCWHVFIEPQILM